jgi:zinc D-Ala-D-Ala dipeptidase
MNTRQIPLLWAMLFIHISMAAQSNDIKPYVQDAGLYKKAAKTNSTLLMVDVSRIIPGILFDLRYTTKNNFTKQQLYPLIKTSYLRLGVAAALAQVQFKLKEQGYALKIFDAYRPYDVTVKMWAIVPDERYAANPANGSAHNRGIAVDVTLVNIKTGNEIDMGTSFDNFTDTAYHNFTQLPAVVIENRKLLKATMEKYGFKALATEWWHYSYGNTKDYDLLNVGFKYLNRQNQQP